MSKTLQPGTILVSWYFSWDRVSVCSSGNQARATSPSLAVTPLGHPPLRQWGEPQATVKQALHTGQRPNGGRRQLSSPAASAISFTVFLHWLPPALVNLTSSHCHEILGKKQRAGRLVILGLCVLLQWSSQIPFGFWSVPLIVTCRSHVINQSDWDP